MSDTEKREQRSIKAPLNYNPHKLPRELKEYYISASREEIQQMLNTLELSSREDLFTHIPKNIRFPQTPKVCQRFSYDQLTDHVNELANKNQIKSSFLGDGLKWYQVHPIVPYVSQIRGLTTAYTPYQPERSQGTLKTLWIYSSTLSQLTGFEAINASFYERATCLFEAMNTALRIKKKAKTILLSEGLYPEDIKVVQTLAKETPMKVETFPLCPQSGLTDQVRFEEKLNQLGEELAAVVYPQANSLGLLEDIHQLTDTIQAHKALAIAVIDPILLGQNGLLPPSEYGEKGADMIVGEGQHLAIGPNYGGPGLGVFGIRFHKENKTAIRSTAGRFVGKALDIQGQECLSMVLSTREQHIRREKATSNICSNQSFLASLAGAAILGRGEEGLAKTLETSRKRTLEMVEFFNHLDKIELAFPDSPFFNEICLSYQGNLSELIKKASSKGLHLGVDVSSRLSGDKNLLLLFFNDAQSIEDLEKLKNFLREELGTKVSQQDQEKRTSWPSISKLLRKGKVGLPNLKTQNLEDFYRKLGDQNVSPDDNIYPLGSCTMKYNPYINDYAAVLTGFTDLHPQAPEEDAQGSLEVLYHIQEYFKTITGLPGVTTQPVAGAQGELVGIKMFQAYHRDRGYGNKKNIIIIPKSAHGTNPATATMAGFETKTVNGIPQGLISIDADEQGQIDLEQFHSLMDQYGDRVAGIMITNPNTSGIFENSFKEIAERLHEVDALVYMDGANMNAIAGWVDLEAMGVDAVHNNLHKTWTIPHGGGGPGDAIVAVSKKLIDYLPGKQIVLEGKIFRSKTPVKTIGSFHRHWGNFAHKVRAYTYLRALGDEGIREMSAIAVLSARYLFEKLKMIYPTLPEKSEDIPRMHEFILTIHQETFAKLEKAGVPKTQAIARIGKLFLDFGLHAPTVAFPEQYGLMVEPTESFSKTELDRFIEILKAVNQILNETPQVLTSVPHFTPVRKVDEVAANKKLILQEPISDLDFVKENQISPGKLKEMPLQDILREIVNAHEKTQFNL